jgi:hypothetical protein
MAIFVSNLVVHQGFDFDAIFELEDINTSSPLNLTNQTVSAQIRKTYTSSTSTSMNAAVFGDASNGKIKVSLDSTITSNLKAGRYVYDVKLVNNVSSSVSKVVEGSVLVKGGVTR